MKRLFPLAAGLVLFCASFSFSQPSTSSKKDKCAEPPAVVATPDLIVPLGPDPARFPARGGSVDWGLALSGGGIRSASFSIGVMKALYDNGLLNKIDVISSVSGGGYASYWLLTGYDPNNAQSFGDAAFRNDLFTGNVCRLQGTSDFLPTGAMLQGVFQSKPGAFEDYEKGIQRSFGNRQPAEGKTDDRSIDFLNSSIEGARVPYYIFNTTLGTKELNGFASLVEVTPTYIGNPVLGFSKWSPTNKLPLIEGVATSAAAVKSKLARKHDNFAKYMLNGESLELSDGGFSENLAALPLIRRGIKNIIIVDAEFDPYYEFEAYRKLQTLLANLGIDFRVPELEKFMKAECVHDGKDRSVYSGSAFSVGFAKSAAASVAAPQIDSRIYYVKMSRPGSIFLKDTNPAYLKGEAYAIERDQKVGIGANSADFHCENAAALPFQHDMYVYLVNRYSSAQDDNKLRKALNKIVPSALVSSFPQTPTLKQSFHREQLEAFVGLGYLQAFELR